MQNEVIMRKYIIVSEMKRQSVPGGRQHSGYTHSYMRVFQKVQGKIKVYFDTKRLKSISNVCINAFSVSSLRPLVWERILLFMALPDPEPVSDQL